MIKIEYGNILKVKEDIICHQVNCMGVMGSGLAKQIRAKYPEVFDKYKELCEAQKIMYENGLAKSKYLLGSVQIVNCKDGKIVANLFGQQSFGLDKRYTDYDALKSSLLGLKNLTTSEYSTINNKSIAIPYNLGMTGLIS